MAIAEIIPAVRALSRSEKFRIAQLLLDDLASEELSTAFKEGQVFPIYTPEYAPDSDPARTGPQGGRAPFMTVVEQFQRRVQSSEETNP